MIVTLVRHSTSNQGTFGMLLCSSLSISCISGELPWLNNEPNLSCIPEGKYECEWTYSPHFKRHTYELMNVPNRTDIRIHPANFMGSAPLKCELNGCIALGRTLGNDGNQAVLMKSKEAVEELEGKLAHEPFTLEILDTMNVQGF